MSGIVSLLASTVAIVVVVLFLATSSDSGSLVVDILTNGGDPNPRWQQRLFWRADGRHRLDAAVNPV